MIQCSRSLVGLSLCVVLVPLLVFVPAPAAAQAPAVPGEWAKATAGLQRREGFVPIWVDAEQQRLLLELPGDTTRVLHCVSLATGLGSNPIGLDRGASGGCESAVLTRVGARVLVTHENWKYRSSQADPAGRLSVDEAFSPSVLAVLPVKARENGRLLVDADELLFRDWFGVAVTLRRTGQGAYAIAKDRSQLALAQIRNFPANTELATTLTFAAQGEPGRIVNAVTPNGAAFSVRQHVTIAALPDDDYVPRTFDPRMSFYDVAFNDYAQPVDRPLQRRWISRHRLTRSNPNDPASPITSPIVYYIDRGMPEPIRSATLEGARFWTTAFERAGLAGGFVVELLPEGVDPLDIRYNVVQWEHRNERGWSIGGALGDPRTGRILKGMARMDSHRGRTAFKLVSALTSARTAADTHFVLGRVRQVTAHEIGHTLGMAHNYIASTSDRASVMDYPAPRITLDAAGRVDLSQAYDLGPGPFDVLAVRWGYGIFPAASEADSLAAIVREGLATGLVFLSDSDARPEGASDPLTNLWDDGNDVVAFLQRQLAVRESAMRTFGVQSLLPGEPVATLQERFSPLYLYHRFAASHAAKALGGLSYRFAMPGDGQQATTPVADAVQRRALAALVEAVRPATLAIPDSLVSLFAPPAFGDGTVAEDFRGFTAPVFDEFAAARTAAGAVMDAALQRERAARLVQQRARDAQALGLEDVIDAFEAATFRAPPAARLLEARLGSAAKGAGLQRAAERALFDRVLLLASDSLAAPDVRGHALVALERLAAVAKSRAVAATGAVPRAAPSAAPAAGRLEVRAHYRAMADDAAAWLLRGVRPARLGAPTAPLGEPFGEADGW